MDIKLFVGDSQQILKSLPDNSVDSVVCDPPYGLNFMAKNWDYDVPKKELWKEVFRVLKPGGHLVAFFGTRTYHRGVVNIEDAGFEIRDQLMWLFGCYSDDTEILTDRGWLKYNALKISDKILEWDSKTQILKFSNPLEIYVYNAPKNVMHIKNRHTDQLVTENHRVYCKIRKNSRNPQPQEFSVYEAKDLKKTWIKTFPLAGKLEGGIQEDHAYIIGWWLTDAWLHGDGKACMFSQSKLLTLEKLRNELNNNDCKYSEYIRHSKNKNHKDEHTFYVTGNLANYLIKIFPDRKITWDILNWNYNSRLLLLEGLLDGDGSRPTEQKSETFWSKLPERLDIVSALCTSLSIRNQIDYKKGAIYLNRKTNTSEFQHKHICESVPYNGTKVWCIKTNTGAFVVRRNGKPFISGNSGFPKSHSIKKELDKKGIENDCDGLGTALKPAHEPIVLARKPLSEKTVAANVLKWGTGAINIGGCRVEAGKDHIANCSRANVSGFWRERGSVAGIKTEATSLGRWPANIIHDGSDEVIAAFPEGRSAGNYPSKSEGTGAGVTYLPKKPQGKLYSDSGSAARFFYCAKASKADRNEGLEALPKKNTAAAEFRPNHMDKANNGESGVPYGRFAPQENNHPTVKPTSLMQYLARLVTPKDGTVLDPFMGSGSTGKACVREEFNFIGIDLSQDYHDIAKARIEHEKFKFEKVINQKNNLFKGNK